MRMTWTLAIRGAAAVGVGAGPGADHNSSPEKRASVRAGPAPPAVGAKSGNSQIEISRGSVRPHAYPPRFYPHRSSPFSRKGPPGSGPICGPATGGTARKRPRIGGGSLVNWGGAASAMNALSRRRADGVVEQPRAHCRSSAAARY